MYLRSIGIAGLIVGILFKTLHWPGANILVLASSVLVIATLALLLRKPGPWSVQLQRPGMLLCSVIAVVGGGLFKIMHWPGANVLLLLGLLTCAAWFLLAPVRSAAKEA